MRNKTAVTFVAAALALSVGNAAAVPYTFTNIAEISSGTSRDFSGPSLNNSGTVAFVVGPERLDLNGFTGSDGPTTTVYDSSRSLSGNAFVPPSLNDSGGMLAFPARLDTIGRGVFTGSGGPITTISDSNGPFDFFDVLSLNDNGTVAFGAQLDTFVSGIFTGSGGPITTIADSNGPFNGFGGPSLNNSGTVAFSETHFEAGGIFTGSGGPITTIVPFFESFGVGSPSLNNSGTVAFYAQLLTGEGGIFIGPDPLADKVIGIGDTLFGSTVAELFMDRESLNDTGQIAFFYALVDGRAGVALANPLVTAAPEPSTLALLIAGLLGAVFWRKGKST